MNFLKIGAIFALACMGWSTAFAKIEIQTGRHGEYYRYQAWFIDVESSTELKAEEMSQPQLVEATKLLIQKLAGELVQAASYLPDRSGCYEDHTPESLTISVRGMYQLLIEKVRPELKKNGKQELLDAIASNLPYESFDNNLVMVGRPGWNGWTGLWKELAPPLQGKKRLYELEKISGAYNVCIPNRDQLK